MLNKKQNFKSGKKGKDKERGFERIKKRGTPPPPKEKGLMKKNLVIEYFDVVLFMKQKQRRNKRKEKDKNTRNQKKAKRKTRRKAEKTMRETEKEKVKKGEAHKGSGEFETKGDTPPQKCPF